MFITVILNSCSSSHIFRSEFMCFLAGHQDSVYFCLRWMIKNFNLCVETVLTRIRTCLVLWKCNIPYSVGTYVSNLAYQFYVNWLNAQKLRSSLKHYCGFFKIVKLLRAIILWNLWKLMDNKSCFRGDICFRIKRICLRNVEIKSMISASCMGNILEGEELTFSKHQDETDITDLHFDWQQWFQTKAIRAVICKT